MIKYLTMGLAFTGHNQKKYTAVKKDPGYIKNNCIAIGPPLHEDLEDNYNFIKNKWMQDRILQLQNARISIIDKEELAKEVFDVIDLDDILRFGFNIMNTCLTGDYDLTYFNNQS